MKQLIIFAFISCFFGAWAQESDPFEGIQRRLGAYFKLHPSETIFVQTDRDLYRAGDVVWFSAFVENPSKAGMGSVSDNLVVCLYDTAGEKLNEDKYKMIGGLCRGDFDLPEDLEPGRYILVAYSGATQNGNEVFMRQLYVGEFNLNGVYVQAEKEGKLLVPGENADFLFVLTGMDGKPFDGKVTYELNYDGKKVAEGKQKTEDKGLLKLKLELPSGEFAQPLQLVLRDGATEIWSSWFLVETEKITIGFEAEGLHALAGTSQKLVFRPVNSFGWPVALDVELLDKSSGKVVMSSKTLAPGFGILPMAAEAGKSYQLRITSGPGKGQRFDLPPFENSGLSLILSRLDEQFIYCSLNPVGDLSGDLSLVAFRGGQLVWATKLTLEKALNLKIPKAGFPQGLCQLVVFDNDKNELASRLVYVDKDESLALDGEVSPGVVATNAPSSFKLKPGNEALVSFSVAPAEMLSDAAPAFEPVFNLNGWMQWPCAGPGEMNETSVNYLLVGNSFKNLSWDAVMASPRSQPEAEGISRARLEQQLPDRVTAFAQQHCADKQPSLSPAFCLANPFLFQKKKVSRIALEKDNSYLNYLHSGSSILDAIKMIKPYTMQGDLIIFPGGTNSFLAQDGALIVIDGQKMGTSSSVLSSVSPYDVESIDISTKPIDIQQYTGLNSVGLIDIKTKRGVSAVVADTKPVKQYSEGNRVPRDFAETMPGRQDKAAGTLLWEPATYVGSSLERQLPAPKIAGKYLVRVWAIDDAGKLGTKQIEFEVK